MLKPRLPDRTILVLVIVFCICAVMPYLVNVQFGKIWSQAAMGVAPPLWLLLAFIIIRPHWRTLTKKAADDMYIAALLGFVGQLAAVVIYAWMT